MRHALVLGVTGMIGHAIASELASAKPRLKVSGGSRHARQRREMFADRIELFDVDLLTPDSAAEALEGVSDLVIAVSGQSGAFDKIENLGVVRAGALAAAAGVERVIHISGASTPFAPQWFEAGAAKRKAEESLARLPLKVVTLRPSWLMESLARFRQGNRMGLIGSGNMPVHWLALADLARIVCEITTDPSFPAGAYPVFGPKAISFKDAARSYAQAKGLQSTIRVMPMGLARAVAIFSKDLRPVAQLARMFETFDERQLGKQATPFTPAKTSLEAWLKSPARRKIPATAVP